VANINAMKPTTYTLMRMSAAHNKRSNAVSATCNIFILETQPYVCGKAQIFHAHLYIKLC